MAMGLCTLAMAMLSAPRAPVSHSRSVTILCASVRPLRLTTEKMIELVPPALPAVQVQVTLTAWYTLTYGEFRSAFTAQDPIYGAVRAGDQVPYIPRHQWNLAVGVEHARAGLNASVNYVAKMREIAGTEPIDQTVATDEQLWADVGAYVAPLRWLRIYANVRNLADVHNIVGRRPYGARPNAPRWVQIGAKATF